MQPLACTLFESCASLKRNITSKMLSFNTALVKTIVLLYGSINSGVKSEDKKYLNQTQKPN